MEGQPLRLESLIPNKLAEFRTLLGGSEFGGCFCAVWTSHDKTWTARCQDKAQPNYFLTKTHVENGHHAGFLVYCNEDLVGWTGSGPKTAFPFLKTKLASRLSECSDETWSIGCLAVGANFRGQGLSDKIIQAVEQAARQQGARHLEAYPTRPFDEPRAFRGTMSLYQRQGFSEAGAERDGTFEIVLMHKSLV